MTSKHPSWAWQAGAVDAARRGDPSALARWFAEHAPDATWRARLALEAHDAATQRALLAECRPGPEHGAALAAVVRDDADAVRAAHAAGADWHAPVRAGLGGDGDVHPVRGRGMPRCARGWGA